MGLGLAARSVARVGLVALRRLATATMKSDKHAASALCSRMRMFNSLFLSTKPSLVYIVSSLCDDSQLASCSGTFGIWVVYVASLPLDEQFQSLSCENTTSKCPQYASPSLSTWIHVLSDCPSFRDCHSCHRLSFFWDRKSRPSLTLLSMFTFSLLLLSRF